jgi:hypothetical protein
MTDNEITRRVPIEIMVVPPVGSYRYRKPEAHTREDTQRKKAEAFIELTESSPEAIRLRVALLFRARLRAGEISWLQVSDLFEPCGRISNRILVRAPGSSHTREEPMCSEVRAAIEAFRTKIPNAERLAVWNRESLLDAPVNPMLVWLGGFVRSASVGSDATPLNVEVLDA